MIAMDDLKQVVADVLDVDVAELYDEMLLEELADWDSVNAVRLLLHLESDFGVRLSVEQVMKAQSLQDLILAAAGKEAV